MQNHANALSTTLVPLDTTRAIWDRCFTIAPLVVVGTREADDSDDIAPKHMACPLGWDNYFGFVCTPAHATYRNIERNRVFAVSFPRPAQWLETSLAASPRCDDTKPMLEHVARRRSEMVDCPLVIDSYLFLECKLERIVDGFGSNSLIAGRVVAAAAAQDYVRGTDRDDMDVIREAPLMGYVAPGRFAVIRETLAFPVPGGMKR